MSKSKKEDLKDWNGDNLIFVDASYLIALIVEKDQWHSDAVRLLEKLKSEREELKNQKAAQKKEAFYKQLKNYKH